MMDIIFEAVEEAGVHALVAESCTSLKSTEVDLPEGVFIVQDDVPRNWLFKHVSCVVHHGEAGITATGISLGKPTVTMPFFGDLFFWARIIAQAGIGPAPIPYKSLTAASLAKAITDSLSPSTVKFARELEDRMQQENGVEIGA